MEPFGHKMFILSQPVPLTGTGVLYPHLRDFYINERKKVEKSILFGFSDHRYGSLRRWLTLMSSVLSSSNKRRQKVHIFISIKKLE